MLTIKEKDEIRDLLKIYLKRYPSQNMAATSLKGTSKGTVSAILNSKYEKISDEMFRTIASQVRAVSSSVWQICKTITSEHIRVAMEDSQKYSLVRWLIGSAGCGKTTTANLYSTEHRNVFVVSCSEDMKKRDFIREIIRQVGISVDGNSTREMLSAIIAHMITLDRPLIVLDEADKLNDNILYYIITLYNKMEDKAGILMMSTSYMEKRMNRGLDLKKRGYEEIYSRIGGKFFKAKAASGVDVYSVCRLNGIDDDKLIDVIIKESDRNGCDFRIVKKAVHRVKRLTAVQS